MRDSVALMMQGARIIALVRESEVEAFAEVYYALSRTDPRAANGIGAAAIVQLAMQAEHARGET